MPSARLLVGPSSTAELSVSLRHWTDSHGPHVSGYTMLELVVTMFVLATVTVAAVMFSPLAITASSADSSLEGVIRPLREARERAIAERRNITVAFLGTNQVQILRNDVNAGVEVGTTVIETITLDGRLRFGLTGGVPDTPDGFGNAAAVDFGAAASLRFTSDGMFVDQTGDPLNGTVFLADVSGDPRMARAVTVFGPTALVRAYRWDGSAWAVH